MNGCPVSTHLRPSPSFDTGEKSRSIAPENLFAATMNSALVYDLWVSLAIVRIAKHRANIVDCYSHLSTLLIPSIFFFRACLTLSQGLSLKAAGRVLKVIIHNYCLGVTCKYNCAEVLNNPMWTLGLQDSCWKSRAGDTYIWLLWVPCKSCPSS